jgi:hypothetical protein
VVALVPGAGQVDGDPAGDGLVVAVARRGQEGGIQARLAGGAGDPGCAVAARSASPTCRRV